MNIKIKLPSTQPRKTRDPKAVQAFKRFNAKEFEKVKIVVHPCPIEALIAKGVVVQRVILIPVEKNGRFVAYMRVKENGAIHNQIKNQSKEKITHIKIKV